MSRISECFERLKRQGRAAFIPYIEAFDPDKKTSFELLSAMPKAGADIIEVGMPFSDPSADGPVIQEAAQRALKEGASLTGVLEMVGKFRQKDEKTPIILMGYTNPIESYGYERFCEKAAKSGVDGLIIVDLPPDESQELDRFAHHNGIDVIRLITPVTQGERLDYVLSKASGFLYYVSIVGITGTRTAKEGDLRTALDMLHKKTSLPVVIGFGIKTPEKAAQAAHFGDGVVVGSALLTTLKETLDKDGRPTKDTLPKVLQQLSHLAHAAHTKQVEQ